MSNHDSPTGPGHEVLSATSTEAPVRHVWSRSQRPVARNVVQPLLHFLHTEVGSGVLMLAAAAVALLWANSPWDESYFKLWETRLTIELGGLVALDDLTLLDWVNEGLMVVFFFLMALEIKHEMVTGTLRDRRTAALPVIAALGGMVVPALIFTAFNIGGDASNGWGIPMATDIAFAVGILSLAGSRVPTAAKVFLLTLAVVDDIGAIVVIAIFYTAEIATGWLALAAVALLATWVMSRIDVRHLGVYGLLGFIAWFGLLQSGVHATLAGVIMGLLTPAWSFYDPKWFAPAADKLVAGIRVTFDDEVLTGEELEANEGRIQELIRVARESTSPVASLIHQLEPWVAYLIVPLFALANAGVALSGETVGDAVGSPLVLGVALGLLIGKPVGVFGATWLAVRIGVGRLPADTSWYQVLGLAVTAGVGFTVALFVAGLSFDDPQLTDLAKVAILSASVIAGTTGVLLLRRAPATP